MGIALDSSRPSLKASIGTTHRQSVDHGFETHVDFAATDDLGHVRRVIGLQQGHLEAFILEVASGLSEIEGSVVRGRVP